MVEKFHIDSNTKGILDNINVGVLYCKNDAYSTILYANEYFYTMVGYTKDEVEFIFENRFADMVLDNVSEILVDVKNAIEKDIDLDFEYRMMKNDGSILYVHDTAKYDRENDCWYVTVMDITSMKDIERERNKLHQYLENMPDKITIADNHFDITYENKNAREDTYSSGWTSLLKKISSNLIGTNFSDIKKRVKNGEDVRYETRYWESGKIVGHDNNYLFQIKDKRGNVINYLEISNSIVSQADSLTKFPTRSMFENYFESIIKHKKNLDIYFVFMDIDNFKGINDSYGHLIGDFAIKETSRRIASVLSKDDYVCRFGGDEFSMLLMGDFEDVMFKLNLIRYMSEKEVETNGVKFKMTYSIGVAHRKGEGEIFSDLMERADKALYFVKNNGKNNIHFISENKWNFLT